MSLAKTLKGVENSIIVEFPTFDDSKTYVAIRLLSALEDVAAFRAARLAAKELGIEKPTDEDPEYTIHLQAEVLATCVEEAENAGTEDAPAWRSAKRRFFASAEEILHTLDQDRVHLLYQIYQAFRTTCGKQLTDVDPDTLSSYLNVMGSDRGDKEVLPFYSQYKSGLQYRLARISASLARSALLNSSGGGPATTPGPGETTPPGSALPGSALPPSGAKSIRRPTKKSKRSSKR